jgi:hypothetical protein
MQETFELVVINVIFKFCEQPADEVANEHHLGLQGAHNGDEDGLQGAGKPISNAKTRWLLEKHLLPKFVRQAVAPRLEIMLKVKHVLIKQGYCREEQVGALLDGTETQNVAENRWSRKCQIKLRHPL